MKPIAFAAARFRSLAEPLLERAREEPARTALVLLHDDENEEIVSHGRLHAGAMAWATLFRDSGILRGEMVIIALRHSLALVQAVWGAFYRGILPSVYASPGPMALNERYAQRLADLARGAGARAVVAMPELVPSLRRWLEDTGCRVIPTGPSQGSIAERDKASVIAPGQEEEIAYVQFTSGSTGRRKGVQLSHRAILDWMEALTRSLPLYDSDSQVSWLPLHHDFGLIFGMMMPVFMGFPTILISPFKWLRKPVVQLQAIHKHRATLSLLPNSALNHLVRGVAERDLESLDLKTLELLFNGSEPVYFRSQQLFLERFAPCGFRDSALATGYGMAESTLGVSISPRGERSRVDWVDGPAMTRSRRALALRPGEAGAVPLVSSGRPLAGMEVVIVDERRGRLPERRIGEIAVRGPGLFSGYRGRPDLSRQVLRDGWYSSGDLGYMASGELYVTGRKKDLIIVGGQNVHPEDAEQAAIDLLGIDPGRAVSFGIPDELTGTDRIVLVCELRGAIGDAERLAAEQRLRRRVFEDLDVVLGDVRFSDRGWIVRTANGKLARGRCREKYLDEVSGGGKG
ncbi:MAG: AMP-binding protein [Candidatus Aminicenantes bacterium]|nr:AMP-binding protein [Candidatus Aminicenantes bacterium]